MERPEPPVFRRFATSQRVLTGCAWLSAIAIILVVSLPSSPHPHGEANLLRLDASAGASTGRRRNRVRSADYQRVTLGDGLEVDSYLTPGDTLVSPSGAFHANLSRNGIFRIYKHESFEGERMIYELGAPPMMQTQMGLLPGRRAEGDFFAILHNDGNLVIQKGTDPRHRQYTVDSSKIDKQQEKGAFYAKLQDDGCFVVYNSTNHPLWWSSESMLYMRGYMEEGDILISPAGKHFAILTNESFSTYEGYSMADPEKKMTFDWKIPKSRLANKGSKKLFAMIQETGDFQIYTASNPADKVRRIHLRSRTGHLKRFVADNYFLYMQDDGELILYGGKGQDLQNYQKVWSSYEACLNKLEVTLANAVSNLPVLGPLYKEVSAGVYYFRPWCSAIAKRRALEGLRSLGFTMGFTIVPFGFKVFKDIKEKGWASYFRVKLPGSKKTHYEVLGVDRDADDEEIKAAVKQLSLQLHPDKFQNKGHDRDFMQNYEELQKDISEANRVLLSETLRAEYDAELPMWDFTGPGKFCETFTYSIAACLGVTQEMRLAKEEKSARLEENLD